MTSCICPCCGAHLDSMSERCDCNGVVPEKPVSEIHATEQPDAIENAWEEYFAN